MVTLAFVLVTLLYLPGLVVALITDAVRWLRARRPWVASRLWTFGWFYLLTQVVGLAMLGGAWLLALLGGKGRNERLLRWTFGIQNIWTQCNLGAVKTLFGLSFDVQGDEVAASGPYILLLRHASLVDTLLPGGFIANRFGIRLRYVLKRELLADPCLDVAGCRLPNHFVARGSGARDQELAAISELATDMGPTDAVLIYPEGTRFTQSKRARALEKLADRAPALHAKAQAMKHVIAPRPGGVKALLTGAPEADVVVGAHYGFDGLASIRKIWSGALVGRRVSLMFWRIPRADVPDASDALDEWLFEWWARVDTWVGQQKTADGAA